ncbi:phage tail tape measure protein [Streptomyces sp. NPDC020607]|uniref:phage tail tape measure protein n=1 Tax=Streptomyces sp. NPDC020607 TaxID=3365082 RepID=UPI0037A885C2
MPRAASVWLDVLPSMAEFRRDLRRDLEQPVVQSASRAGSQGGEAMTSSLRDKVKAGAAAVGVALGAAIAASTVAQLEKEKTADRLAAQLGLSGKQAERAGKVTGSLYSKAVVDTFEEGAEVVRQVMGSGLIDPTASTKAIEAITTKVSDLAKTFDQDLAMTSNAAAQMIRTGLAKDGTQALDLLTRGFQTSANKADDLAETVNEYGVQWKKMGLDGATGIGLLNQAIKGGARDADIAADAIKEFSIRAVDGSDTTKDGFKALGLSATDMATKFGKGGKIATAALDLTLDRLRAIEDPVKREAAAVALFGTQAEDLGQALFKMDVSTAADSLGKVGGAAKKMGDTLRNNTSTRIEVLKRQLTGAFGAAVNAVVLPGINGLITGVRWLGEAAAATGAWFGKWGAWLIPLAVLIGGLTLALNANAIATGAAMAVMGAYALAVRGVAAVTRAWAAAQALFNAIMALNPFVLVAIALVALGAAFVVAWQKSETFRTVVLGVWAAVQTGAMWLWNNGLKPVIDGFMTGLSAIGSAAVWLWTTVLSPVFSAINIGARILATALTVIVFGPIYVAVRLLGAVFSWLWSVAIKPVLGWIGAGALVLWAGLKTVFGWWMAGLRGVGSVFKWLWTSAAKPALGGIVTAGKITWAGLKVVFGLLMTGLRGVGAVFKWLWTNGVRPAMSGIKSVVSTVYSTGIKPVFDRLKDATRSVSKAFDVARAAIKVAWDKVKGIAKTPVAFIINTVYNKGIVAVWNKVASKFGAPTLNEIKGFARGGVLPGQSTYRQGDDQLVPMRRGEGVAVSEAMRDPYERRRLLAVNAAAMRGQSLRPFQGEGFSKGGIFGWVDSAKDSTVDAFKSGVGWLKDGVKASVSAGVNAVVKPLINKISGSASAYKAMVTGVPKKIVKTLLGYSGEADKKLEAAGIGGGGYKSALRWAKTQHGKPYQWAGNGNPSWDCSGFMSAIESVIRGQKPHRRWATGAFAGPMAPGGWVLNKKSPFMIGITNAGVGHTAGTLNGTNVESRGGDGVVVGSRARSAKDFLFTHRYGFAAKGYADGGKPRPGEVAWVGERGPELVRFGSGSAEVYNHRDSVRMLEGVGARGFAKGTTATKARKDLPGDLKNFTKSLTGSAAAIAKASKELAKDLRATGGSGKALAAQVTKVSAKLQAMAKQRDAVSSKLAAAKTTATDQKKTAADFMGLSNMAEATSVSDVLGGMRDRQSTVRSFQGQIAGLSKKGLNQDLIGQLVAMGPDSDLAGVLAGASPAQIKQLNAMAKSGAKLSTGYGRTMADAMFDAGKNASKGFLTGLQSLEKEIQASMAKIGAGAVKAIRSKKGIDARSPSRKGKQAGADLGAGLVAGMVASGPSIESAAARLGAAAVPAGVVPVTSGTSAAGASGPLGEGPLYLVVEDGTVLRAYVSDRVDDALTDVRRSKRAGSKKG